jgi:myo-inositol-1(or 4)-monophosphatase
MKPASTPSPAFLRKALAAATEAALAAGQLMKKNLARPKKANEVTAHDIKLELDVRCQKTIERILHASHPEASLLGEEGLAGDQSAPSRWVVDPIDGTVNFAFGIPHACVSIALQTFRAKKTPAAESGPPPDSSFETVAGVVYDPFLDEMWSGALGGGARLNGRKIAVSQRGALAECIVAIGFAKYDSTAAKMLPVFNQLASRARKVRVLGAAALSMAWVAAGRLDAYREYGLRLWDIAAAGLIVEEAGGEFWRQPVDGAHAYEILASNGRLRKQIEQLSATPHSPQRK